jgi:hypothetical protein
VVGSYETLIDCNAGDYIEVAGSVSNTDVTLEHFAADATVPRPADPCGKHCSEVSFTPCVLQHLCEFADQTVVRLSVTTQTAPPIKTYAYILVG